MIYVIVGPTGVGKTKLSIELAKELNAEIINGDSMQVYKELNIATAKIKESEKENIPHHLFDICEVEDNYTVYDYQKDCREKIEDILNKGKNVIIVGGTGLYIKAALYDYEFKEEDNDIDLSNYSSIYLLNKIKEYDLNTDIHINNRKRLERAYIKYLNNNTKTINGNNKIYNFMVIGLTTDREILYDKINKRVDIMVEEGLLEESKSLYDRNIHSKAIDTGIGYKELYKYFDGTLSLEQALELIKKNSRHYAKRQYTFFNHQLEVNWFKTDYDDFNNTIKEVLKYIQNEKLL